MGGSITFWKYVRMDLTILFDKPAALGPGVNKGSSVYRDRDTHSFGGTTSGKDELLACAHHFVQEPRFGG